MRKTLLILSTAFFSAGVLAQEADSSSHADTSRTQTLKEVTVMGTRNPVQILPGKTIINVDASLGNTGATVLEVLEKSPGISMDRNGNISLKGRQGVMIMIDGKPSQLSGPDLNNLLSGMTASQVDQIEIIDNPSAKYDAAGNAGIINIRTKKNRQKGFNGNLSMALGQGRYTRSVNTLSLNYFAGKVNLFGSVGINLNQNFTDLYAFRTYYGSDNKTPTAYLEQPAFFHGKAPSQTFKLGADYFLTPKTTIGMVAGGTAFTRNTRGNTTAIWMNAQRAKDSTILTRSTARDHLENGTMNLNVRHTFNTVTELTADFDFLSYRISNAQFFSNVLSGPNGYFENYSGVVPSRINILTGKADYTTNLAGYKVEGGWKSSHVGTNNSADYFLTDQNGTIPDLGKTNHFLYNENIHAAYVNGERQWKKLTLQAGFRYERTSYNAEQLGNAARKDSSFSRKYGDLFPTTTVSLQLDSINNISLQAGRRIDRPPFQTLNPFVFVINKYTYETGNPYFRPQYTWNTEVNYSYKNMIIASLSYSYTKDYFSQIFLSDSTGIIYYSQGNLDKMVNVGVSVSVQALPLAWWSLSADAAVNHKQIHGFVYRERTASLMQMNVNMNNQFKFAKGWSGEISGYYTLKEQELQEVTDPTGQINAGFSKQLWKDRGTFKMLVRDIFYTQAMKGNTSFNLATEYFSIKRDSRSLSIAFSYRFGKQQQSQQRKTGGADDEMKRVNSN